MEKLTIEEAVAQLEQLVSDLEHKPMSLSESLDKYRSSLKLLDYCYRELGSAKGEITEINNEIARIQQRYSRGDIDSITED